MILVLASIADREAVTFASEFGGSASVLTCNHLLRGPIRLFHPGFCDSSITVAGRAVPVREISAVLNLLPAVMPNELTMYPAEERAYQAAEVRALLTFFLSELVCPVINRATPMSLTGPVLNPASWFAVAERAGIPLAAITASSCGANTLREDGPAIEATAIGGCIVEPSHTVADTYTSGLAHRCKLDYLRARYRREGSEIRFLGADSYPDIRNPRTRASLRKHLLKVTS